MVKVQNNKSLQFNEPGPEGEILVAVFNDTIYVKPFGFATQENALGLPDFLSTMLRKGTRKITFDLQECAVMDSTFLGVIASAALDHVHGSKKNVLIINSDERARRQVRNLGLTGVVALKAEPCDPPPDLQLSRIDFFHLPKSEKERLERIKDMHEQLVHLNARNRQNFGAFIEMLDEELEKDERT